MLLRVVLYFCRRAGAMVNCSFGAPSNRTRGYQIKVSGTCRMRDVTEARCLLVYNIHLCTHDWFFLVQLVDGIGNCFQPPPICRTRRRESLSAGVIKDNLHQAYTAADCQSHSLINCALDCFFDACKLKKFLFTANSLPGKWDKI